MLANRQSGPPSAKAGIGGGLKKSGSLAFYHALPPPPAKWDWRRGSYFPRKSADFELPARPLAEGVPWAAANAAIDCSTQGQIFQLRRQVGVINQQFLLETLGAGSHPPN